MWPSPLETADLVTCTEEILNGKLHFLCSVSETYLEPTQRSKMELFKKMINGFTFSEKAPSEMFEWVLNAFLPLAIGVSARKIKVEKEIAVEKIHCTKKEVFH